MKKTQIRERCQTIIEFTPHGQWLTQQDTCLVHRLFQYHPEREEKEGVGVQGYTVDWTVTETYPGNWVTTACLHVVRLDGSKVDFSFNKCIGAIPLEDLETFAVDCEVEEVVSA